ncbi:MAG TPA: MFS transporter [Actinomycetota bacterium]
MTSTGASQPQPGDGTPPPVKLHGWRDAAILTVAGLTVAAGFAQFGATAALGDVAKTFGAAATGRSIAAQVGLSGTTLGLGLAIIRLASLLSLPLTGLADRHGRRRTLISCVTIGLALTATAALSPTYWWFVALFAAGRPLLSATNALSGVVAAEETQTRDRAKAIAMVTAGYGLGAGLTALARGTAGNHLSFRGLFALALIPLAAMPLLTRRLEEPDRYRRLAHTDPATAAATLPPGGLRQLWAPGRVRAELRSRLWLLTALYFSFSFVTGPAVTFVFLYAENALGMPRSATTLMVLAAGPLGLLGLLSGRWAADTLGRRRAAIGAQASVALAGIITYSGTPAGAIAGYLLGIIAGGAYSPASWALAAELFPTSLRATIFGWLTAANVLGAVFGLIIFGRLADSLSSFPLAATIICIPVIAASLFYIRLPETAGLELEQSAPE